MADRIHDPGRVILGRGLRVAVVTPLAFGIAEIAGAAVQTSIFVAFGSFALLGFCDFGGPPRRRLLAYVAATGAGALLIVIGTPFAREPLLAGALALPVAFTIRFIGGFGGQLAAAVTALTLAFVLAVALEAPPSAIGDRLLGWGGAGAVSVVAALLLWPHYARPKLIRRTGEAVAAFAEAIGGAGGTGAREALEQLRLASGQGPLTHSGSIVEERALLRIIDGLVRLDAVLPLPAPELPEGEALRVELQQMLRACSTMLAGGPEEPDELALDAARVAHRTALGEEARRRLDRGVGPGPVVDWLDSSFRLRLAAYHGLSIASNSLRLLDRPAVPDAQLQISLGLEDVGSDEGAARRAVGLARKRLRPGSAQMRDAARAAIGIAAAVVIAGVADISHGFWVVLATLMVLRSNALGTGRTAIQAVGGTVIGFLIGSALMLAIGTGEAGLWIALPFAAFLAAYAPTAIHFIAGQAAFALFVVVLFNLIQPVGWEVGLVRVETVAIGAGVSLLAGLLLWPRGALPSIGRGASEAYRAAARYLADALGAGDDRAVLESDRELAQAASLRTGDAIIQHRTEPGVYLSGEQRLALLDGPRTVNTVADGILTVDQIFGGPAPASPALDQAAVALCSRLEGIASEIEAGGASGEGRLPQPDPDLDGRARTEVIAGLRGWGQGVESEGSLVAVEPLRLVWRRDWLRVLAAGIEPLEHLARESAPILLGPWYRR